MSSFNAIGVPIPFPIDKGGTSATTAAGARAALGIQLGARTIEGTADQILVQNGSGALGNPVISLQQNAILPGVNSMSVPRGTLAQRPGTPVNGMIRLNTDTGSIEMYGDSMWFYPNGLAFANTIYVAKNGNDAHAGNRLNAPKLTIQAAIDASVPGGLVWVLDAGQYSENLTIDKTLQLYSPCAELDGTGSGDLITISGGGTTVVRITFGDINQGGPGLAMNIVDPNTTVFMNGAIFLGSITCEGNLILSEVAQIISTIHILSTGLFATYITNAIGCTFIFDVGSTVVGNIQEVIGPGNTVNTIYGSQLFNDLVTISNGFPIVSNNVTLDHTNLAGASLVPVVTAVNAAASYRISNIMLNGFDGINFSGGDRDLLINDGAAEWTVIPAATLQALVNNQWGSVDVPFPGAISLNQSSIPGTNITATYANGTTDYTAGSLVLTIEYERIA